MFEIITHNDANELISLSESYLEQNESQNTHVLGWAYKLTENASYYVSEPPLLLSILAQGRVVGAVIMLPWNLYLSRIGTEVQPVIAHLVHHLRGIGRIPTVWGPAAEVEAFAECWTHEMPSVSAKIITRMRAFEIRETVDLPLSQGKLRLACTDDHLLMAQWLAAYREEVFGAPRDFDRAKQFAEKCIRTRVLYIWEHNEPVSIAIADRPTRNGIAIYSVYTPPENRRKGYATSSVLLLTKKLLSERYSFCCLHTDLANPTSNSIYTKIGYVPVGDGLVVDFVPVQ